MMPYITISKRLNTSSNSNNIRINLGSYIHIIKLQFINSTTEIRIISHHISLRYQMSNRQYSLRLSCSTISQPLISHPPISHPPISHPPIQWMKLPAMTKSLTKLDVCIFHYYFKSLTLHSNFQLAQAKFKSNWASGRLAMSCTAYITPTNIMPTNITPTHITPTYITSTNITPTYITPTNIRPTNITPTYITPTYITHLYHTHQHHTHLYHNHLYHTHPGYITALAHLSLDKMVAISQTTFSNVFLQMKKH